MNVDGVPISVARISAVLSEVGGDVHQRLLTDARMKQVWRTLLGRAVDETSLDAIDGYARLPRHEEWEYLPPPYDVESGASRPEDDRRQAMARQIACGAFFAHAIVIMSLPTPVIMRDDFDNAMVRYADAAALLRSLAWSASHDTKTVEHLREAARHVEEEAAFIVRVGRPRCLVGTSGIRGTKNGDEDRLKLRNLAVKTRDLYGHYLKGTIATTMNVALGYSNAEGIDQKTVENWCRAEPPLTGA